MELANIGLELIVDEETSVPPSRPAPSKIGKVVPTVRASSTRPLPRKGDGFPDECSTFVRGERQEPIPFPTTRFYGSKRRQLGWLQSEFEVLEGTTALDAFGGTGSISHLLGSLGWQTTYNDIFEFNIISARAIFSDSTHQFSEDALLQFLDSVQPYPQFIATTFDGLYFTAHENMWLDGFMQRLREESGTNRDLLLYCLFQACLKKRPFNLFHRANLNLRDSKMPVKFGNRTTWNKSFKAHILETYREVKITQRLFTHSVTVLKRGCASEVPPKFDLVYLDPPYFKYAKENTETYLERYHFLEGLARHDEWPSLIDTNSPIRAIKGRYKKEWASKHDMLDNLKHMIKLHNGAKFALSYVSGEEPEEAELFKLFQEHFDSVRLSRRSFKKALSKKESFEILIIGQ